MTSKNNKSGCSEKSIQFFSPVLPVSASRPRVSKWGSYYSKSYTNYRKEQHKFLKSIRDKYPVDEESLFSVELEFICYKPKKPSNPECPRYDIDNMEKAILDAITFSGMVWGDDIQIVQLKSKKRYQREGEAYGTNIRITKVESNT